MPEHDQNFTPPATYIGEEVYWYADPLNPSDPALAWIHSGVGDPDRPPEARPKTATLLVTQADGSFAIRRSVRHKDDPGLLENAQWRQWGCWEPSKRSADIARLVSLLPGITSLLARSQTGKAKE
jgi:hypothetical protein